METDTKMTRERARELILQDNPKARVDDVELYSDQFVTYLEAARNIAELGAIVAHPRTAAPMDNPYLKIRQQAMNAMLKLSRLRNVNSLWDEGRRMLDAMAPTVQTVAKPARAAKKRSR